MYHLPNNKASYLPDSMAPQEFVSSQPPPEKKGVLPKMSRKRERSTFPRPQDLRNCSFSAAEKICS